MNIIQQIKQLKCTIASLENLVRLLEAEPEDETLVELRAELEARKEQLSELSSKL